MGRRETETLASWKQKTFLTVSVPGNVVASHNWQYQGWKGIKNSIKYIKKKNTANKSFVRNLVSKQVKVLGIKDSLADNPFPELLSLMAR